MPGSLLRRPPNKKGVQGPASGPDGVAGAATGPASQLPGSGGGATVDSTSGIRVHPHGAHARPSSRAVMGGGRPHDRPDCPTHPFVSTFPQNAALNSQYCPRCLCFVCGVPIARCEGWNTDGSFHCHAHGVGAHGSYWRAQRNEKRKERAEQKAMHESMQVPEGDFLRADLAQSTAPPAAVGTKASVPPKRSSSFRGLFSRHKRKPSGDASQQVRAQQQNEAFPPSPHRAFSSQQQGQGQGQGQGHRPQSDRRVERTQRSIVNRPDGTTAVTTTRFFSDGTQEIVKKEGQEAAKEALRLSVAPSTEPTTQARVGTSTAPRKTLGSGPEAGSFDASSSGRSSGPSRGSAPSDEGLRAQQQQRPHRIPLHKAGTPAPRQGSQRRSATAPAAAAAAPSAQTHKTADRPQQPLPQERPRAATPDAERPPAVIITSSSHDEEDVVIRSEREVHKRDFTSSSSAATPPEAAMKPSPSLAAKVAAAVAANKEKKEEEYEEQVLAAREGGFSADRPAHSGAHETCENGGDSPLSDRLALTVSPSLAARAATIVSSVRETNNPPDGGEGSFSGSAAAVSDNEKNIDDEKHPPAPGSLGNEYVEDDLSALNTSSVEEDIIEPTTLPFDNGDTIGRTSTTPKTEPFPSDRAVPWEEAASSTSASVAAQSSSGTSSAPSSHQGKKEDVERANDEAVDVGSNHEMALDPSSLVPSGSRQDVKTAADGGKTGFEGEFAHDQSERWEREREQEDFDSETERTRAAQVGAFWIPEVEESEETERPNDGAVDAGSNRGRAVDPSLAELSGSHHYIDPPADGGNAGFDGEFVHGESQGLEHEEEFDSETERMRVAQVGAFWTPEEDFGGSPVVSPGDFDKGGGEYIGEVEEDIASRSQGKRESDGDGESVPNGGSCKVVDDSESPNNDNPRPLGADGEGPVSVTPVPSHENAPGDKASGAPAQQQISKGREEYEEEDRSSWAPSSASSGGSRNNPEERKQYEPRDIPQSGGKQQRIVRHPTPSPEDANGGSNRTDTGVASGTISSDPEASHLRGDDETGPVEDNEQQNPPVMDRRTIAGAAAGVTIVGATAAATSAGSEIPPSRQEPQRQQQAVGPSAADAGKEEDTQQGHPYSAFAAVLPFMVKKKYQKRHTKRKESSGDGSTPATVDVDDIIRRIRDNDPRLAKFSLFDCKLGDSGARRVAEGLQKNNHLAILDLGRNGITENGAEKIAKALKENNTLQTLWLRENPFGLTGVASVASALESNKCLTGLSLGRNRIPREGGWHLAEALRKNSTLHTLWLYGNDLGDQGVAYICDALLMNKSLKELYLGGNGIDDAGAMTLCNMLSRNRTLNKLELFKNRISDEGATCMADALRSNCGLIDLNLRSNNITLAGAEKLVSALGENIILARLDLRNNALSREVSVSLANAAAKIDTVCKVILQTESSPRRNPSSLVAAGRIGGQRAKHALSDPHNLNAVCARLVQNDHGLPNVDLSDDGLHDDGLSKLSDSLRQNETVRALSVRNNGITQVGIKALASALRDANATGRSVLEELNLGWNDVCDVGTVALANAFVGGGNRTLSRLLLNNSAIGNEGAVALAQLLEGAAPPLAELHLRHNTIGSDGVAALSESLLDNTELRWLFLGWNDVGPAGAESLADMLRSNESLSFLDVDGNNIGPDGTSALSFALKENSSIDTLWLANNDVGVLGLESISEVLAVNVSLRMLDLEYNDIGEEGAIRLSTALSQNKCLETLWLGGNRLGDKGAECLAEILPSNVALKELSLRWNGITRVGARAISSSLSHGRSCLETLWIGGNPLGDKGISLIAEALWTNASLAVMSLDFTGMTDDGASALFLSFEENGTLTDVNLDGNNIADKGILGMLEHKIRNNRLAAAGRKIYTKLAYIRKSNEYKEEV